MTNWKIKNKRKKIFPQNYLKSLKPVEMSKRDYIKLKISNSWIK